MATVYGVNRTLVRAGTAVDARKAGGPVHVMTDSYVFNATVSGTIVELELLVKTGDIIVDFLVLHPALGTSVTMDMGFGGGAAASAAALLDDYAVGAAAGAATPDSQAADVVAGSITNALQGAIGIPATSDQRVCLTTAGATTTASALTVIVILWVASQP